VGTRVSLNVVAKTKISAPPGNAPPPPHIQPLAKLQTTKMEFILFRKNNSGSSVDHSVNISSLMYLLDVSI
jgi:hypothetical protein